MVADGRLNAEIFMNSSRRSKGRTEVIINVPTIHRMNHLSAINDYAAPTAVISIGMTYE